MNKIETAMRAAVDARRNWREDNTEVCIDSNGQVKVYLHGNHIATVTQSGNVQPNADMFYRWTTATTASRLRALGVDARIKGRKPFINGKEIM